MLKLAFAAASLTFASPAAAADLDPLAFFSGRTHGDGKLKIVFKASIPVRIESRGTPDGRGGLVLDQIIREGAKPERRNRWVLHPTSPTTFSGTVTEASSLVRGSLLGRVLRLNYVRKDGTRANHVLTLQPDGRTMISHMTIKKLGLVVARVEEVIRKPD